MMKFNAWYSLEGFKQTQPNLTYSFAATVPKLLVPYTPYLKL